MSNELPVDAGMIGIMPVAAINRPDAWLDGGQVVKVGADCCLSLQYDNGRVAIRVGDRGAIPVETDSEWWIGDPCYVLKNNLDEAEGDWTKAADPSPGYWAACVASLKTPRYGQFTTQAYQLDDGMLGLVASTMWGDGFYRMTLGTFGAYLLSAVVETGDSEGEEDDVDEEE